MKKLLSAGLAAVVVALASGRPADAWVHSRFSVGLNWEYQSGNNNFLWGLWHNGQVPDCGFGGYPDGAAGGQTFPYFGNAAPQTNLPAVAAQFYGSQQGYADSGYQGYSNNLYHPASYQPNYYTPNYSAPQSWYYPR